MYLQYCKISTCNVVNTFDFARNIVFCLCSVSEILLNSSTLQGIYDRISNQDFCGKMSEDLLSIRIRTSSSVHRE